MDALSRGLDAGAQKGAGRAFTVGPGDVKHRRQLAFGMPEPLEQALEALEPEVDFGRMQLERRRQQRVEHRIVGMCGFHRRCELRRGQ